MAFDGLFIHSLLNSIKPTLVNGRLSKIYQPFEQDLVLTFRNERKNYQLLISANAQYPRFYLTKKAIANPDKAPTFVMVLRKYLEGSILQGIEQVGVDRIVNFRFSNRNELGDQVQLVLSVELMGRHSNVILYDNSNGHIIDLLKRINPDENRARILLPKAKYELPPLNPGINGFDLSEQEFKQKAAVNDPSEFAGQINGLDRDDRSELIGYLEDDFSYSSFRTFINQFDKKGAFVLLTPKNKRKIFPYLPYHLDLVKESSDPDLNHALDEFYLYQANHDWVKQKSSKIERLVKNEQKKLTKKVVKLKKQLEQAENSEGYRIRGEILNANLAQVKPGMTKISLPNYYDNNRPIEIKLDAALSPARNGQKYFTRYKKLRDSIKHVKEQIEIANDNLRYFDSIQTAIDNAEPEDIDQITDELINQGYLKRPQKQKRKKKVTEHNLNKFRLSSGKTVLVGKNNYQNDWLTLKKANKTDIWFHVKNIPGSHVILQDANPSDDDILEAAEIAAYFSKAKNSAHVQVDYVQDKRVKKPNGARPGFVIYTGQNSIEVTPEKERVLAKRID
ncbi:MAG: NFACT RNA binding domain-containing protein [Lactobacillus panisapium]|uniref:Rqc2 family fibronectin-binding protein n=1 Tax=Lactobacillus panisapium TaxID=2012495 RepID=UPI001C6A088D|nr:NFACT RNA binding domain-containing protein [Lactobacillus panisapium]MCT6820671.1 NFACT RNA binding domain-containing protein [Lactobacillus panisapium]MCT6853184.1 NFACT RNA binding domain-containing protein [Lactobacillus panisapium]MCT6865608.1 NFACT RNA binding domain-containing protein [Lactobacillus panisapium]QYN58611.1 fibronectin/fibrinogen-binding protein [Lactobacillus panisapium]